MTEPGLAAGKKLDQRVNLAVFDDDAGEAPKFSTDVATAWRVVDEICDRGYKLQLSGSRIWQARFYKSAAHTLETQASTATGSSPAEAICIAALIVLGAHVRKD